MFFLVDDIGPLLLFLFVKEFIDGDIYRVQLNNLTATQVAQPYSLFFRDVIELKILPLLSLRTVHPH